MATLLSKVVGSRNDRLVKKLRKEVVLVNALEPEFEKLSDEQLQAKTTEFRERLSNGETLDSLQDEAFAAIREAGKRVLGMRHFDTQLVGAKVMHQGKIAEMRTGEGKTLVATAAAYLNALSGDGVHVITVNDYLASRDSEWMGRLYGWMGLTVGLVVAGLDHEAKKAAYAADIVYGTNNEFGFDYLRDNMAFSQEQRVQRGLNFAIIDEVDSILIDEARTPLIISGSSDDDPVLYQKVNLLVPLLSRQIGEDDKIEVPGDFTVDEKGKQIYLTESGHEKMEAEMVKAGLLQEGQSLYSATNLQLVHHINAALRAHNLYTRDVDYIVDANGDIVIVDEFTGRTMPGRRWSEGLHQAVEAKEGVAIQSESQTMASITFQNYFRLYNKLSGMTGTADTEAPEFMQIYKLEVVVIPTNKPMIRDDRADLVYLSTPEKFNAIVADVRENLGGNRPVLVGTASIEASEYLSQKLTEEGIKHEVLNAKQHEREAGIIAGAGMPGSVTIATNMAGRGTDIVLGGNLEHELESVPEDDVEGRHARKVAWQQRHDAVLEAGGLHIIGTERHESRRIDNQLRGRAGRQGDAGSSRFYLGLDDNLMRIFGGERIGNMMQKLGLEEGEAIEHPWVNKAIANAQKKVEGHNFDIRKNLLEYDDVANDQRKIVYQQRNELMDVDDVSNTINRIREDVVAGLISEFVPVGSMPEQWNISGLQDALKHEFLLDLDVQSWLDEDNRLHEDKLRRRLADEVEGAYRAKEEAAGAPVMRHLEKAVMLQTLDQLWKDHLAAMDYLRQGINLRSYAQKNPKQEYKLEAFEMFTEMLDKLKAEVTSILLKVKVRSEEEVRAMEDEQRARQEAAELDAQHADAQDITHPEQADPQAAQPQQSAAQAAAGTPPPRPKPKAKPAVSQVKRNMPKVGRNDPCPCGSGKKFKQCHGQLN